MPTFPEQLTAGQAEYRTTYNLARGQVLIEVDEEADGEELSSFLAAQSFETPDEPTYKQRAQQTLGPAGLRWVTLPEDEVGSFDVAEASLGERAEVTRVRPIYYEAGGGPATAATPYFERLLVEIDKARKDEVVEALGALGLAHNAAFSAAIAPTEVFELTDPEATLEEAVEIAAQAATVPGVQSIEFDWLKLETFLMNPNDTLFANQWNMATISAPDAWDVHTGNPNVWVAMIDSGFDLLHPDLSFTPNTAGNATHCNADDFIAGNPTPYDASSSGVFHGTACAGIAAATISNNRGVAGVAGNCQIMPVRLGTVPTSARVTAGINWARFNGASVCSLSLGTTSTTTAINAVVNAWNAGLVLCAATGNDAEDASSPPINFPANHPNVIAVGASDQNDQRKRPGSADGEDWGSQYGAQIDVVAPGVRIWTTDEQGATGYTNGDYVSFFNGTSAATPHVAGLAALIMSVNPTLTNQQVRDLIESTCDKISPALYPYANTPGRPNGTWHQEVGYGRINADRAVRGAVINTPPQLKNILPIIVDENSLVNRIVTAVDAEGGTLQFKLFGPPFASITPLSDSTAKLTVQPGFEDSGNYLGLVKVTDPGGLFDFASVSITVRNVNRAPVLANIGPILAHEGSPLSRVLTATDPDLQAVVLSAAGLPDFATFSDAGGGSGTLTLQPDYKDAGLYHTTVTVTDPEGATDSETFSIRVINVLMPLVTQVTELPFQHDQGVIELKVNNLLPNLASQVQIQSGASWVNITNDNGDRAWFHETLVAGEVVRYAYGPNALGGLYRWVIYDKAEGLDQGWAVSAEFFISEMGKHIVVEVTLPDA